MNQVPTKPQKPPPTRDIQLGLPLVAGIFLHNQNLTAVAVGNDAVDDPLLRVQIRADASSVGVEVGVAVSIRSGIPRIHATNRAANGHDENSGRASKEVSVFELLLSPQDAKKRL